MTDVKSLYAKVTRAKIEKLKQAAQSAKQGDDSREENRIIAKFRSRAREDFGTLKADTGLSITRQRNG